MDRVDEREREREEISWCPVGISVKEQNIIIIHGYLKRSIKGSPERSLTI